MSLCPLPTPLSPFSLLFLQMTQTLCTGMILIWVSAPQGDRRVRNLLEPQEDPWGRQDEHPRARHVCRGPAPGTPHPAVLSGKGCGWHMASPPSPHASHFPLVLSVGGFACKQQPLGNTSNPSLGYYSSPANLKASPFFSARHPQSRGNSSALT